MLLPVSFLFTFVVTHVLHSLGWRKAVRALTFLSLSPLILACLQMILVIVAERPENGGMAGGIAFVALIVSLFPLSGSLLARWLLSRGTPPNPEGATGLSPLTDQVK